MKNKGDTIKKFEKTVFPNLANKDNFVVSLARQIVTKISNKDKSS